MRIRAGWIFSHELVVKIVLMFVWKRPKINEKEAGDGLFVKFTTFEHNVIQGVLSKTFVSK